MINSWACLGKPRNYNPLLIETNLKTTETPFPTLPLPYLSMLRTSLEIFISTFLFQQCRETVCEGCRLTNFISTRSTRESQIKKTS